MDACKGVKLYSVSIPGMTLVQDLPASIDFHFDGETFSAKPFITRVDGQEFTVYAAAEDRSKSVRIQAEINSYSYVFYNREASEYTMVTLDDGSEWGLYVANDKDGKPYSVYASRVLSAKDDKTLYFTYQLTVGQGGMVWADLDAFKADLNTLASSSPACRNNPNKQIKRESSSAAIPFFVPSRPCRILYTKFDSYGTSSYNKASYIV